MHRTKPLCSEPPERHENGQLPSHLPVHYAAYHAGEKICTPRSSICFIQVRMECFGLQCCPLRPRRTRECYLVRLLQLTSPFLLLPPFTHLPQLMSRTYGHCIIVSMECLITLTKNPPGVPPPAFAFIIKCYPTDQKTILIIDHHQWMIHATSNEC